MNMQPNTILSLLISNKERNARNRSKSGYNIYQSWFYHDWHLLSETEKIHLLLQFEIHQNFDYNDDDSLDSNPPITSIDMTRLCAKYWGHQNELIKLAWRRRAEDVNALPVLGAFTSVQNSVFKEKEIMHSLTQDFDRILCKFQNVLKTRQTLKDSMKEKRFGCERFTLRSKVYKSFFCSHLLHLSIFGTDNSFFAYGHEIAYRTKRCTVVHLLGMDRIEEVFTVNGLCMLKYDNDDGETIVSGGSKVIVVDRLNGKEAVGLVKGEEDSNLLVLLENREEVVVKKPLYGKDDGHWHYYNNDDEHQYGVKELDPVRIKFLKSGFIHICFNKVTLNGNKTKCLF